jgi:SsrA-binding protein
MSLKGKGDLIVHNKKAGFEYFLEETFSAGIMLTGSEVKSLRMGKGNLQEAYVYVSNNEVFLQGMNIPVYENGAYANHNPVRERKLLLKKKEIRRLQKGTEVQGNTIVPVKMYFSDRNMVKVDIALAKGKKLYDKRETIKGRDIQREMDRHLR